jgi:hypothetical protein
MPRPVESAAGRGFAPGPSPALACRKTPHFRGPPPQKCKARMPSVTCLGFSSLSAIFAVRASCRLPQLRCWVAPSSKAVCQAKPATPLLLPPLLGKPSACSTWTLFLSNFAGTSPSKMLRASRRRPFRPLAQTLSVCAVAKPPKTAPVGERLCRAFGH